MKNVQYNGNAQSSAITDAGFAAVGVSSRSVTWRGHGDIQEISDEAADYLQKHDGSRFAIVVQDEPDDS